MSSLGGARMVAGLVYALAAITGLAAWIEGETALVVGIIGVVVASLVVTVLGVAHVRRAGA